MSASKGTVVDSGTFGTPFPEVERWLRRWTGVRYTYRPNVPLATVDFRRSQRNQARLGDPIDADTVKKYTKAMLNGDELPAIVVHDVSGDMAGVVVVDGNHRAVAALEASQAQPDAVSNKYAMFVLDQATPAPVVRAMTMHANVRNGMGISERDRIQHALYTVNTGVTVETAAGMFLLPASKLRTAKDAQDADQRATEAGVHPDVWGKIGKTIRTRLKTIRTDEGLAAAAALVADAGLTVDEVADMLSHLTMHSSGEKQRKVVAGLREGYTDRIAQRSAGDRSGEKGGGRNRSPVGRFRGAIAMLRGCPPIGLVVAQMSDGEAGQFLQTTRDDLEEMLRQVDEVSKKLAQG